MTFLKLRPVSTLASLAVLGALGACSDKGTDAAPTIVGGQVVTESSARGPEYRSTVAVTHEGAASAGRSYCSGTLVDAKRNLVLTAAHCFQDIAPGKHFVFFGTSVTGKRTGTLLRATRVIVHPGYDHELTVQSARNMRPSHDIALLRFEGVVPAGFEATALPASGESIPTNMLLAGFGTTGALRRDPRTGSPLADRFGMLMTQSDTGTLRSVSVAVSALHSGGQVFGVRGRNGRPEGACPGDSGGPAYAKASSTWKVYGVLSTGRVGGADTNGDGRMDVGCTGVNTYTDVRGYASFLQSAATRL